ncbi:hypothetical protein [Mesoterricola sediminis]|uniref:Uncharacterized protein n=1 Tax=Mesoterricola sediminis TaxID=2927980 RepID=A0AA48H417_9BACT|nr:hypothetical protein [Mesoterricola sediminis]BDU77071.1 hypothetical protein METESE_20290 [Mesoterricola sediminis]
MRTVHRTVLLLAASSLALAAGQLPVLGRPAPQRPRSRVYQPSSRVPAATRPATPETEGAPAPKGRKLPPVIAETDADGPDRIWGWRCGGASVGIRHCGGGVGGDGLVWLELGGCWIKVVQFDDHVRVTVGIGDQRLARKALVAYREGDGAALFQAGTAPLDHLWRPRLEEAAHAVREAFLGLPPDGADTGFLRKGLAFTWRELGWLAGVRSSAAGRTLP